MTVPEKKIYFASDFHLGAPDLQSSRKREDLIVGWLNSIHDSASEIFLVGDLFDFWFEYKHVIPKGYIRLLGKLAQMADSGVKIHIFTGNHDLWMRDYFKNELKATIIEKPVIIKLFDKTFYIAHGDGLGPADYGFKFIKGLFNSKINQKLFRWLHPDLGSAMAHKFSWLSRQKTYKHADEFLGEEEWLVIHSREILKNNQIDYFVFGHRHCPVVYQLSRESTYINLGDWLKNNTYGVFDGTSFEINRFEKKEH